MSGKRGVQSMADTVPGAVVVVLAWALDHTAAWKLDATTASALTIIACALSSLWIGSRRA